MTIIANASTIPGVHMPDGWVAGTWTIDPAHTTVTFAVRHLMSRVRGTFSDVSGQIVTRADPLRVDRCRGHRGLVGRHRQPDARDLPRSRR
jgi:polyisoprenoid-binding protein YceI